MTKVKVDVQLLVTGGVGDGKSAITQRILKAIQADQGLQSICKLHPGQSYEILRGELTRLTFAGELMQNAEMKKPSAMYSAIPGYPNADAMLSYLTSVINETELSEALKKPIQIEPGESKILVGTAEQHVEYKPFKILVNKITGELLEFREGEGPHDHYRVITLLAAAEPTPVGEQQPEAQTAETVGSGPSLDTKPGKGYLSRCASVTIPPKANDAEQLNRQPGETHNEWRTRIEMIRDQWGTKPTVTILDHVGNQDTEAKPIDNRVQGVATMERLEGESDVEYRNRNKLGNHIVIPAYVPVKSESAAPKPDAHDYNLADNVLQTFKDDFADEFQIHTGEESPVYPGGLTAGVKVQIITLAGNVLIGEVGDFHWSRCSIGPSVVYWRRM